MSSENFLLCISELWTHNKDFSNLTFIFSCYIVAFGKNVVTLHPDKWRTKSEERRRFSSAAEGGSQFKSRFPIKGHERNKWTIKSEECHSAHGPSPMVQTQIFHSSLLTLHSLAAPLQVRTKFAANPIPEWEIEGRQWAQTTNPSGDYRLSYEHGKREVPSRRI